MMLKKAFILMDAMLILVFFIGCGPTPYKPLDKTMEGKIHSADVYVMLEQIPGEHQTGDSVVAASAAGVMGGALGGLLVALANEYYYRELAKPIAETLTEYDFGDDLCKKIGSEASSLKHLKINQLKYDKDPSKENKERLFSTSDADVILFLEAKYCLKQENGNSSGFDSLDVTCETSLFCRSENIDVSGEKSKGRATHMKNAIYTNTLLYNAPLILGKKRCTTDESQEYWIENTRSLLETGTGEIAKMLVFDLNGAGGATGDAQGKKIKIKGIKGCQLSCEGERSIIRDKTGRMYSLCSTPSVKLVYNPITKEQENPLGWGTGQP